MVDSKGILGKHRRDLEIRKAEFVDKWRLCQITNAEARQGGIFRGTLDVRARTITNEMCFAAAEALANQIGDQLDEEHILPNMDDWEVFPREAAAVGMKAQEQGVARLQMSYDDLLNHARTIIKRSRDLTQVMMHKGFIAEAPNLDQFYDS